MNSGKGAGKGNISAESFTKNELTIKLHGHCQQKAIASTLPTKNAFIARQLPCSGDPTGVAAWLIVWV